MGDIPKGSALYLHAPKGTYDCDDCSMFIDSQNRCVIHSRNDYIAPEGSCGYFIPGPSGLFGYNPLALVTKQESGYVENVNEASCKRCDKWLREGWDCQAVDKDSIGDDPGMIHPDACCCLWVANPLVVDKPNEYFEALAYVERSV